MAYQLRIELLWIYEDNYSARPWL